MQDISDKYLLLEETEKQAVRKALVEERSRFCTLVSMLRPVVVSPFGNFILVKVYVTQMLHLLVNVYSGSRHNLRYSMLVSLL
jgi:rRNA pseudouridine-1189 N-methylase Emg1 (Nep1/Mra1 family)